MKKKVPFACLTATALPSVEKAIIVNLQMHSVLRIMMIPDRLNIRYNTLKFKSQDKVFEFFKFCMEDINQQGYEARRILVFCRNHNHCRILSRLFDQEFGN